MDRYTGGLRESSALLVVWITFVGHFYVSFCQSSCFAWFWVCILVYLRVLPCVLMDLLDRMDSSKEAYGLVDITTLGWHPLAFWPSRSLLCVCRWEGLLDFKSEKCGLSSGQGLAPSLLHLGVSVHRAQTPAFQPESHLSPASLYLEVWVQPGWSDFHFHLKVYFLKV